MDFRLDAGLVKRAHGEWLLLTWEPQLEANAKCTLVALLQSVR